MPQLVRQGEALPLPPVPGVHDDHRHIVSRCLAHPSHQAVDGLGEPDGQHLHPPPFQEFHQVGDRLGPQAPVVPEGIGPALRFHQAASHRPGSAGRLVPLGARQTEQLLDHEVALQQVQHAGLDLGFLPPARDRLLPEVHRLHRQLLITGEVVHRDVEGVGQREQHPGAGHRLPPLVLSDGLRRDPVVDRRLQPSERQSSRRAGQLQFRSDHLPFSA